LVLHGSSPGPSVAEKELLESGALVRATDLGPIFALQRNAMTTRRTKSLSTKVTESEYAQVQGLAGAQTISEWARTILLRAAQPDPITLIVVAEILAVRTILLNLHFAVANGNAVTPELMQTLIDRADQEKWTKARARLDTAKSMRPQ